MKSSITELMINREILALAMNYGLGNIQSTTRYDVGSDRIETFIELDDQVVNHKFSHKELSMSLDDLTDRVLLSLLKPFIKDDKKFIHEDCT